VFVERRTGREAHIDRQPGDEQENESLGERVSESKRQGAPSGGRKLRDVDGHAGETRRLSESGDLEQAPLAAQACIL
jgi:hypothetical protein